MNRTRVLSAVLPGLPQLIGGRTGAGVLSLGVWLAFVGICATQGSRVMAGVAGGWDERIAVLTLLGGLVCVWAWSWRDSAHSPARIPGQWVTAVSSFSRNRIAVAALVALVWIGLLALLTPILAPGDPFQQDLTRSHLAPSDVNLLGTDEYGRDVLTRIMFGARISLTVGLLAVAISVTIGTVLGAIAGFVGGWLDSFIMRSVDVVISFPRLVLLILVLAFFEGSLFLVVLVLGLTLWPGTARLVRGEVLSLREREFVQAAVALGFSKRRIILRHLIPNALGPVVVAATLGVGHTMILEAGLSFLGVGLDSDVPSWGTMINDGRGEAFGAWWLALFPGVALVITVLSFNLVGDGLRDALDPRLRS